MSSILKALQRLQGERGGASAQPALRDDLARELAARPPEPAGAPGEAAPRVRWGVLAGVAGAALAAIALAGFLLVRGAGRPAPPVADLQPPAVAAPVASPPVPAAAAPAEGAPRIRDAAPARPSAPPEEAPTLPASSVPAAEGAEPEPEIAAAKVPDGAPAPPAGAAIRESAPAPAPPPALAPARAGAPPAARGVAPPAAQAPHVELAAPGAPPPAPAPSPEPAPLRAAPPAAPAPAFEVAPPSAAVVEPAAARPAGREPDFAVVTPPPEIAVLRTSWHPRPERRVARVRLAGASAPVEVREGDALSTLVVKAIEPSGVVFLHGGRELRRGVE